MMNSSEVGSEGEWTTFYCDDGTPYYFNSRTQVTQWELPAEYVAAGGSAVEAPRDDEACPHNAEHSIILENPEQPCSYATSGASDLLTPPPPIDEACPPSLDVDLTQDLSYRLGRSSDTDIGFPEDSFVDTLDPELPPPPASWDASLDAALSPPDDLSYGMEDEVTQWKNGMEDRIDCAQADDGYTEEVLVAMLSTAVNAADDHLDDRIPVELVAVEDQCRPNSEDDCVHEDADSVEFDRILVTMQSVERMNDEGVLDNFDAEAYLGIEFTDEHGADADFEEVTGIDFDKDASFVDEVTRLGVCTAPSQALRLALDSGRDVPVLRRRLEILDDCLQSCGSDDEWADVISKNDFALVKYLQMHFSARVHQDLVDRAAKCLALCSAIVPSMWPECLLDARDEHGYAARAAVCTVYFAARRLEQVSELTALSRRPSVSVEQFGTYVGFDARDIKDFNMEGMGDVLSAYKEAKAQEENELDTIRHKKLALCMLICQILSRPIPFVGFEVAHYRSNLLGGPRMYEIGDTGDMYSKLIVEQLLFAAGCLLRIMGREEEDVYVSSVRSLAFINSQFPFRPNHTRHRRVCFGTEISELAAPTQTHGSLLAEGLMYAANEVGYPRHTHPEAVPVLRLCASLVCEPGHGGFFYTNDVRVLIDVIIRELTNLPAIEALQHIDETALVDVKAMYIRLAGALADHSSWRDGASHYRMEEVHCAISLVVEVSGDAFGRAFDELQEISEKFQRKIRSV